MKLFTSALTLSLVLACACSSTSSGGGGDAGTATPGGGATTLSCMVQLNGFEPQCQFYEASGKDAVSTLEQLRAGCIDQTGAKAQILEACPTANGLGGCKTPIQVKGGAVVSLFITNFEYKPTGDGGLGTHTTAAEVESFCTRAGAPETYVPVP
jgi:hypothetical protein